MTTIVFPLPGNEAFARTLATRLGAEFGLSEIRHFPDGESYVRIDSPVAAKIVVLVCTLDRPDAKFMTLAFMAATARELGASRVGVVSPYLAYMRQDKRFQPGEAITSAHFAKLLSEAVDFLVTIDPHLHRHRSLAEIFSIPALAAHAAPSLAAWIRGNVPEPVLIGPDSESEQWVASVASSADAPYVVLQKIRSGDRQVEIKVPRLGTYAGQTPVLVDDIISTGRTMLEVIRHLASNGCRPAICMGVHGIFSGDAYATLRTAGAVQIVTCNTIPHESNAIDVTAPIAEATRQMVVQAQKQ